MKIKFNHGFFNDLAKALFNFSYTDCHEEKFGGSAVRLLFYFSANSELIEQIKEHRLFIPILQYPSRAQVMENEIGSLMNFRIFLNDSINGFEVRVDEIDQSKI